MPSSDRYSIIEPHPSVPRTGGFIAGGRGGAGNYKRYNASELTAGPTAQGPASRLSNHLKRGVSRIQQQSSQQQLPPSILPSATSTSSSTSSTSTSTSARNPARQPKPFSSIGIGGAGNMFAWADTEERVFQFDEEMVKRRETGPATPVYHIGRGGGGNWVDESKRSSSRSERAGSASSDSASSCGGGSDVASEEGERRRSGVTGRLGRLFGA